MIVPTLKLVPSNNPVGKFVEATPAEVLPPLAPGHSHTHGVRLEEDARSILRRMAAAKRQSISRKTVISFLVMVLLPVVLTAVYMFGFATDQYVAEANFAVRGNDGQTGDLLGLFSAGSPSGTNVADSYIVSQYVQSRSMVENLEKQMNLQSFYDRNTVDWYARFRPTDFVEDLILYWQSMTAVAFDTRTGIINFQVRAFSAPEALRLAQAVVTNSDKLVNALSEQAQRDAIAYAERDLSFAEAKLKIARQAVTALRNQELSLDPMAAAQAQQKIIAELEGQITESTTMLRAARSQLNDDAPTVRSLQTKVTSLNAQLVSERAKIGSGVVPPGEHTAEGVPSEAISAQIARYQDLATTQEFAEKAYISALATYEHARSEAGRTRRYFALFDPPALPQDSLYPKHFRSIAVVAVFALLIWGIAMLLAAAVRDHVS